jgi:lipopolysaccharide transport system ATP-binding protein
MGDLSIMVEGVGKRYRRGTGASTDRLSERIGDILGRGGRRGREADRRASRDMFWALRDVSFEVAHGNVVGIIGRNGSGKSTLLKVLSRITPPTEGRVVLWGRVASLLEVGTGFHPDLTGRENVYLNGTILGMRRREVARKFDEIVEFSGVSSFIDTPVKRYSSGMYVRLAFAVAAHLEPEILLVDEVLAVGDAEFQKKCLGKMHEASLAGRTVIFVSHNMAAVRRLCDRTYWLHDGRLRMDGPSERVVRRYLLESEGEPQEGVVVVPEDAPRNGTGHARIRTIALLDENDGVVSRLYLGQPIRAAITIDVKRTLDRAAFEVGISSLEGERIVTVQNVDFNGTPVTLQPGRYTVKVNVPTGMMPGDFMLDVATHHISGTTADHVQRALRFTTLDASRDGTDYYRWPTVRGYARPASEWQVIRDVTSDHAALSAAEHSGSPGEP